ncbi:uncharacterized protein V1510DRAFT_117984 [Dipodascopsis tothii]|uniref:uncharacterized protein n=1 Tax=Dipodascopsis tothii TaxID=44089 RepID=UPI0034CD7872
MTSYCACRRYVPNGRRAQLSHAAPAPWPWPCKRPLQLLAPQTAVASRPCACVHGSEPHSCRKSARRLCYLLADKLADTGFSAAAKRRWSVGSLREALVASQASIGTVSHVCPGLERRGVLSGRKWTPLEAGDGHHAARASAPGRSGWPRTLETQRLRIHRRLCMAGDGGRLAWQRSAAGGMRSVRPEPLAADGGTTPPGLQVCRPEDER